MKVFEIIFILLLLLPLALLMRFFISKLSAETPQQRGSNKDYEKPSVSAWFRKKNKELDQYDEDAEEEAYARSGQGNAGSTPQGRPDADRPAFVPRAHTEMRRTERIPFSQMQADPELGKYVPAGNGTAQSGFSQSRTGQTRNQSAGTGAASSDTDSVRRGKRSSRSGQDKKKSRSEKRPTKRQKRKNRERARKRERNRRAKSE